MKGSLVRSTCRRLRASMLLLALALLAPGCATQAPPAPAYALAADGHVLKLGRWWERSGAARAP